MDIQQIKELLQKYRAGTSTHSENELVENWYRQLVETGELNWDKEKRDTLEERIGDRIMKQVNASGRKKVFYMGPRLQWWAAASVIVLLGAFSYYLFSHKTLKPAPFAKVSNNDVEAPRSNKATITLANGQRVYLDRAGNGALAIQGNVKLLKLANGKIVYQQSTDLPGTKMVYNTLSNPRGSRVIDITLADGSKVWLNAASSLTYPVSFVGNERKVAVTGEAYFEIAHNASKSFIVSNGTMDVLVLGTHFNVNAFEDNGDDIRVTLLEGSVKINSGTGSAIIRPGQQAVVTKQIKVTDDVDLDLVMAWKNGYFQFDNAGLKNVLKEVSRWYDVDVIYEGYNRPRQFVGEIQRDLSLSEMLKLLERNKVHFKIEGKKLMVIPD